MKKEKAAYRLYTKLSEMVETEDAMEFENISTLLNRILTVCLLILCSLVGYNSSVQI